MSLSTDFFGTGEGGLFPTFIPDGVAPANYNDTTNDVTIPAFNSYDGGGVEYPRASTGNLVHEDKTNTPIWTLAPTAVYTGHTNYIGGRYDAVDDLFWVATYNSVNDELGLSTINAAGTVVNVGASTAGSALPSVGISALRRSADGTGNLIVNTNAREIELNFATGAIVSDVAIVGLQYGAINLAPGLYAEVLSKQSSGSLVSAGIRFKQQKVLGPSNELKQISTELITFDAAGKGLPITSGTSDAPPWVILESGSHVVLSHDLSTSTNMVPTPFWYDKATFLLTLNTMARNYGLI